MTPAPSPLLVTSPQRGEESETVCRVAYVDGEAIVCSRRPRSVG